jgi:predicted amidohydrolase YtcJ
MAPDLIVVNGDIHTMDPARPVVEALAITAGRIMALGTTADIRYLAGKGTRVIDAGGRMVLPGFQDAHIHLLNGGVDLVQTAYLYDATTIAELQSLMAAHASSYKGALVMGAGWQCGFFGDENLTRAVLDAVVPDRPCLIYDGNFHNACLNSAACQMIGLDMDTPDPLNGHFVLDANGVPTGMLHEEAINWSLTRLPQMDDGTFREGLRAGQAHANRHGITGIIDPWILSHHKRIYSEMAQNGGLTLRVSGAANVMASEPVEDSVTRIIEWRAEQQHDYFQINAAKFFLDGGLENRTAAMIEPYADAPGGNAPLMFSPDQIARYFTAFDAARFQIHVHCIGDRAVRAALDGFETARAANREWPSLHQIAHVEVVHPLDLPRFAKLGVMANCQPLWAAWDPIIPDETMDMVGPARMPYVYPFRSLIDAGAPWCINSDFAVTTLNPFEIIETAVTRQTPRKRGQCDPFVPDQRITAGEALLGYTRNAAAACWRSHHTGALMRGMSGDFIILDRNILSCDPYAISETEVQLTVLAGHEVWRAANFDG